MGHLYCSAKTCLRESSGKGEGVEFLLIDPFEHCPLLSPASGAGRFANKRYHLKKKASSVLF